MATKPTIRLLCMKDSVQIRGELVPPANRSFGVEIEVEGRGLPTDGFENSPWDVKHDGSLKVNKTGDQAYEYLFKSPLPLARSHEALDILSKAMRNSVVYDSVRAGTHIHINVQDLTVHELMSFLTVYYILESTLVENCGEGRSGNLFCLRLEDCYGIVETIRALFQLGNGLDLGQLRTDHIKYSAMNLAPLTRFGTVEFRAIRTPTKGFKPIVEWLDLFHTLLVKSTHSFQNPLQVIEQFSDGGFDQFLGLVLEPDQVKKFITSTQDWQDQIWEGVRNAQDYVFSINWMNLDSGLKDYADKRMKHIETLKKIEGIVSRPTKVKPAAIDIIDAADFWLPHNNGN